MAPAQTTPAATAPVAERRGWFRRHWKWLVPTLVLIPVLLFFYYSMHLRSSEPFQLVVKEVLNSPDVKAKLGEPITQATWLFSANVEPIGEGGDAVFVFPVKGPKGRADVLAECRRLNGQWQPPHRLDITFADGERFDLARKLANSTVDDSLKFDPSKQGEQKDSGIKPPIEDLDIQIPPGPPMP